MGGGIPIQADTVSTERAASSVFLSYSPLWFCRYGLSLILQLSDLGKQLTDGVISQAPQPAILNILVPLKPKS